jgi:magnesium-transporting ATPase (P-type)
VNSNSHLIRSEGGLPDKRIGDQTECSLLEFVNNSLELIQRQEANYNQVRDNIKVLKNIPFNSDTKKMSVAVEIEPDKMVRVFTKGAPENIVDDCAPQLIKSCLHR